MVLNFSALFCYVWFQGVEPATIWFSLVEPATIWFSLVKSQPDGQTLHLYANPLDLDLFYY